MPVFRISYTRGEEMRFFRYWLLVMIFCLMPVAWSLAEDVPLDTDRSGQTVNAGVVATGDANQHSMTIKETGKADAVTVGSTDLGTASNNKATGTGGEILGGLIVGSTEDGNSDDNTVDYKDGSIGFINVGSGRNATSSGNAVTLDNVQLTDESTDNIVGLNSGTVSDNKLVANNGTTIAGGVWVGQSGDTGDATHNTVELDNVGTMSGSVAVGLANNGDATYNTITQTGGAVSGAIGTRLGMFGVLAGSVENSGSANNNEVTLSGVAVQEDVGAGISFNGSTENNIVKIQGGSVGSRIVAGHGSSATLNSINLHNVEQMGSGIRTGIASNGDSTYNSISIFGGTVGGGYIVAGDSQNGNATGNSVTLRGNIDIGSGTTIYGGVAYGGISSENRLNAWTGRAMTLTELNWFQEYSLLLDPTALSTSFITVTGLATDLTNARIDTLDFASGGSGLNVGDEIVIIDNATGILVDNQVSGSQGIVLMHDYTLSTDGGKLTAKVTNTSVNPQTKSLGQFRIAGMTGLNQASDLVAGQGMAQALAASAVGRPSFFTAVSASDSRTKTGSFVDTTGVNFLLGFGYRFMQPNAGPVAGVFMETGYNRYDSENEFFDAPTVRGKGNHKYIGGGLMGRWDRMFARLYSEGSFRIGHDRSKARIDNYVTPVGADGIPEYRVSGTYYGAHAGLGYEFDLPGCLSLDFSAKYFWNRQKANDVTIASDHIRFDASDSQRIRIGGRLTWQADQVTPYAWSLFRARMRQQSHRQRL